MRTLASAIMAMSCAAILGCSTSQDATRLTSERMTVTIEELPAGTRITMQDALDTTERMASASEIHEQGRSVGRVDLTLIVPKDQPEGSITVSGGVESVAMRATRIPGGMRVTSVVNERLP